MSEKYRPKKGDRVRVVMEGEVLHSYSDFFDLGNNSIDYRAEHVISIEKLAPPEPEWVYGAVVKPEGYVPAIYDLAAWRTPTGSIHAVDISRAWQSGTLRVLWNGDPGDE